MSNLEEIKDEVFFHHADPVILDIYGNPLGTVNPVDIDYTAKAPETTLPTVQDWTSEGDTFLKELFGSASDVAKIALSQQNNNSGTKYQYLPASQQTSNTSLFLMIGIGFVFLLVMIIIIKNRK